MNIHSQFKINIRGNPSETGILTGRGMLENLHRLLKKDDYDYSGFLILADKTAFSLYGKRVFSSLKKLDKPVAVSQITPGENSKDVSEIIRLIRPYFRTGFNRRACLISLGGGVTSDIGGFIASILLRGIDCIHLPTTLLSQIDAALGGKTGVNFSEKGITYKNMLGTFYQPGMVIADTDTLKTLPRKEIQNGLGEMVKYWIGWATPDISQISKIKNKKDPADWGKIIALCQKIKLDIVQKDPLETRGERQKLNLGHTIGHAIEGAASGKFSHGEAVAIGLAAAARISLSMKLLKFSSFEKIIKDIASLTLPIQAAGIDRKAVLQALSMDKKGGAFVLLEDIGKIRTGMNVPDEIISKVLSEVIID